MAVARAFVEHPDVPAAVGVDYAALALHLALADAAGVVHVLLQVGQSAQFLLELAEHFIVERVL